MILFDKSYNFGRTSTTQNTDLMPVAWLSTRWWDWCMPEDEKKEIEPIFTDKTGT